MPDEIKYHISPSILDKFNGWRDSSRTWDEYYGFSENPQFSDAEWEQKVEQELIDAVNGVVTPSSRPADLGTCWNEVVDCLLLNVPSTRKDVFLQSGIVGYDGQNDINGIIAVKGENKFLFHTEDALNLKTWVEGTTPQEFVKAPIKTMFGNVELYGFPDYYKADTGVVVDLKTASRYEGQKYANYAQRLAYPYILHQSGKIAQYSAFVFLVCKVYESVRNPFIEFELFNETYYDTLHEITPRLTTLVEDFIFWYQRKMDAGICNDRLTGATPSKK